MFEFTIAQFIMVIEIFLAHTMGCAKVRGTNFTLEGGLIAGISGTVACFIMLYCVTKQLSSITATGMFLSVSNFFLNLLFAPPTSRLYSGAQISHTINCAFAYS